MIFFQWDIISQFADGRTRVIVQFSIRWWQSMSGRRGFHPITYFVKTTRVDEGLHAWLLCIIILNVSFDINYSWMASAIIISTNVCCILAHRHKAVSPSSPTFLAQSALRRCRATSFGRPRTYRILRLVPGFEEKNKKKRKEKKNSDEDSKKKLKKAPCRYRERSRSFLL